MSPLIGLSFTTSVRLVYSSRDDLNWRIVMKICASVREISTTMWAREVLELLDVNHYRHNLDNLKECFKLEFFTISSTRIDWMVRQLLGRYHCYLYSRDGVPGCKDYKSYWPSAELLAKLFSPDEMEKLQSDASRILACPEDYIYEPGPFPSDWMGHPKLLTKDCLSFKAPMYIAEMHDYFMSDRHDDFCGGYFFRAFLSQGMSEKTHYSWVRMLNIKAASHLVPPNDNSYRRTKRGWIEHTTRTYFVMGLHESDIIYT